MELSEEFKNDLENTYRVAAKRGYRPRYLLEMIAMHGGVNAAKNLVGGPPQEGLFKLHELGLLKYSVENLILDPKYDGLFSTHEKELAGERMRQLNWEPGEWDR